MSPTSNGHFTVAQQKAYMMLKVAKCYWLFCIVITGLVCLMFHLMLSGMSQLHIENGKTSNLGMQYSSYIDGRKANKANIYITKVNYTSRVKPKYFIDIPRSFWQFATYYAAGEIARRYGAKYLVDVGCGKGDKLAAFRHEFRLVAVDFKDNLQAAAAKFPFMTFIEANLDQGAPCQIKVPIDILSQAVVISADVVEHIVDPFFCYTKVLQEFSQHALAMVVSTPDRNLLNHANASFSHPGPPYNPSHVREWLLEELVLLMLDEGMYPLQAGFECMMGGACATGFFVKGHSYSTSVIILGNSQVRAGWLKAVKEVPRVVAFVIIDPDTHPDLLSFNLDYLQQQGIEVVCIAETSWKGSLPTDVPILRIKDLNLAAEVIDEALTSSDLNEQDWVILLSGHEVVSFPESPALKASLRDALVRIGQEPHDINAVALSVFFMQDANGKLWDKVPFKMFGLQSWNAGNYSLENMRPVCDTFAQRVRIFKKGRLPVTLLTSKSMGGRTVIVDVVYLGRRVYPFHSQSLRFHPSFSKPFVSLPDRLHKFYMLESTLGYFEEYRKAVTSSQYLY